MTTVVEHISKAQAAIQAATNGFEPEIALVLGSGLGALGEEVQQSIILPYSEIPGFPVSTVKGHKGKLITGLLCGKRVVVMQGRAHYYEAHSLRTLAFPVRVLRSLGAKTLIVTNAAGAVNPDFRPGNLMVITDHINFVFNNPLIGPNSVEIGPRFPDTSRVYSPRLTELAKETGRQQGLDLKSGVYQFMTGPSYETPAEVRMASFLGADAIGMSTFPEALAASHCGMEVLGISFISNLAAGLSEHALSHQEVIDTMKEIKEDFLGLIKGIVDRL